MKEISIKIWLPVIIIVLVIFGLAIYFGWPEEEKPLKVVAPLKETAEIPSDWKTYRNEDYRYEVKYPPSGGFMGIPYSIPPNSIPIFNNPSQSYPIVDFSVGDLLIKITARGNNEKYKTLNETIEKEAEIEKKGFVTIIRIPPDDFQKIQVGGLPAVSWFFYHEAIGRMGVATIAFNEKDYFYEFWARKPSDYYLPEEFGKDEEKTYYLFLSTFNFLE